MFIDDAMIEKPYQFTIVTKDNKERRFCLFPVTLGKLHLLKRHMDNLGINIELIQANPYFEALRIATEKKEELCRLITIHTLKKKRDIFDSKLVSDTVALMMDNTTEEELATLLIHILTSDNVDLYRNYLGITDESQRLSDVLRHKESAQKNKNNYEFGGKTIYGTLIDVACERYGWPYDYVLWGISLVNLQLMLSDKIQSVYLTDDELKKIPSRLLKNGRDIINADSKESQELIKSMDWK